MRVLAIEPYYDGSHKAFIDGWIARSRYDWHLLTMPARKWKWRMRGAAIEMAAKANELHRAGQVFDSIFCCDMLNLAEFTGLVAPQLARLPKVAYFHENQLTYPCRVQDERDYQYAITNITTALAADAVWFNSAYHRDDFLAAAKRLLAKMPDYNCLEAIDQIAAKSQVFYPPITAGRAMLPKAQGKLKIIWAARWEHDKNPEDFFTAIRMLREMGVDFSLSVVGQSFRDLPQVFERARVEFAGCIEHWGFLPTAADYRNALAEADVFISTATHEFFGISAVEAAAAGCCVVLPERLAYPEVFGGCDGLLYDGSTAELAKRLTYLAGNRQRLIELAKQCLSISKKYIWENNIPLMDEGLMNI